MLAVILIQSGFSRLSQGLEDEVLESSLGRLADTGAELLTIAIAIIF